MLEWTQMSAIDAFGIRLKFQIGDFYSKLLSSAYTSDCFITTMHHHLSTSSSRPPFV